MSSAPVESMTTNEERVPAIANEPSEHAAVIQQLLEGETVWDQRLIRWSDWVNPILVKETRQALKSKQFSWTLLLLTVVVLGWSLLAIIGMIPSIYYASNGSGLLITYALILVFPAFIIIPQAMFRSMASELEDGTFETLSLSSLSPSLIIMGKLSVAALQLLIYLSLVAPCIALTYLLRGVTLEVIAMVLAIITSCSLSLSAIAISVASFSKTRSQQVFFSIVLLAGQVIAAFSASSVLINLIGFGVVGSEGWIAFGLFDLGVLLYSWLLLRCGTCSIGVSSENRSTPIRVSLLTIGLLMAMLEGFFSTYYADRNSLKESLAVSMTFLFVHWGVAGSMLMGEHGIIPARARRSLPSSLLGRLFLTWLNPGAGPAYVFVLISFAGPVLTLALVPWILVPVSRNNVSLSLLVYAVSLASFLALYLGVVRLLNMFFLRRLVQGRLVASFAITLFLVVMAVVGTCALNLAANDYKDLTYAWYCFPNLFWTIGEFFPSGPENWASPEEFVSFVALVVSASVVALINVLLTAKDVVLLRIETPERVIKERQKDRRNYRSDKDDESDPDAVFA